MALTFADIKQEFDESVGYIRNDITAIRRGRETVNYTVGLLIGCGCEMLAASGGDKKRRGQTVFAELLPLGDWRLLAERLYTALRDGLAHGFDTKHLVVDGQIIQVYISWSHTEVLEINKLNKRLGLYIGVQPLSDALCAKINEFENLLRNDSDARERFRVASEYQRIAILDKNETAAWRRLVTAAGY
jgi:hypothetical protein